MRTLQFARLIQLPTLKVLAEAAEIGLPETATVPASAFDPILRPFIVKRVRRAVDSAAARTTSKHADHALRLAFLECHPEAPKDLPPDDERAVLDAFNRLAPPYLPRHDPKEIAQPHGGAYRQAAERDGRPIVDLPKRKKERWPVTTPAMIAMAVGAIATTAAFVVPRLLPSPSARFTRTPFGAALVESLADDVASHRVTGDTARAKLLSPAVKKQIGDAAFESLGRALDEVPQARVAKEDSTDDALAPLFLETNELDARLLAKKVPAYFHVYGSGGPGHRSVWLTAYFVERRDEIVFDDKTMKTVWGRRLDNLNLNDSGIYKANAEEWAVMSMDKLELEFVQSLLAPIAKGAPIAPDDSSGEKSSRAELSRVAGRVVADELTKVGKVSSSDAEALHKAIAQRNEIVVSLSKIGYRLGVSSAIEVSPAVVKRVKEGKGEHPEDAALLEDFLRANDRAASYRREMTGALGVLGKFTELELAGLLRDSKKVPENEKKLGMAARSTRGRMLVSTWLAGLANEKDCPKLAFWRVARNIFDPAASDLDTNASATALDAMLRALGLESRPDIYIDEASYKAFATALELPPEKIRDAARRAYQDVFGAPPPSVVVRTL